jgi:hypothetical protein
MISLSSLESGGRVSHLPTRLNNPFMKAAGGIREHETHHILNI